MQQSPLNGKATLRESEEKYRTLFETIDEGFAVCQLLRDRDDRASDYRVLEINPAYERHTGTTAARVLGEHLGVYAECSSGNPWLKKSALARVPMHQSKLG